MSNDLRNNYLDADEVNANFSAPFSGSREMYALQKGLELGHDNALALCEKENQELRDLLRECLSVIEPVKWSAGYDLTKKITAKLGES